MKLQVNDLLKSNDTGKIYWILAISDEGLIRLGRMKKSGITLDRRSRGSIFFSHSFCAEHFTLASVRY